MLPYYPRRPTGLNFGEQTGTGVFPLVHAVHNNFMKAISVSECGDDEQKASSNN